MKDLLRPIGGPDRQGSAQIANNQSSRRSRRTIRRLDLRRYRGLGVVATAGAVVAVAGAGEAGGAGEAAGAGCVANI